MQNSNRRHQIEEKKLDGLNVRKNIRNATLLNIVIMQIYKPQSSSLHPSLRDPASARRARWTFSPPRPPVIVFVVVLSCYCFYVLLLLNWWNNNNNSMALGQVKTMPTSITELHGVVWKISAKDQRSKTSLAAEGALVHASVLSANVRNRGGLELVE